MGILWMTAGLGCDGDTISVTAATQPSIEDLVTGAFPWIPKVKFHNPFLAYENGDEFVRYFRDAAEGNLTGLHAHPVLAGLLGFIPGVGAMYNGQFVKALAHVLIFAVFVSLSDKSFVFGLLIAAWVFYQVFDAAQTAKARRDGLPLPNPFGLNDLGSTLERFDVFPLAR